MDIAQSSSSGAVVGAAKRPKFLGERFDRFGAIVRHNEPAQRPQQRAFMLTPRRICAARISARLRSPSSTSATASRSRAAYFVGRMTSNIDPEAGREGARDRHRLRLSVGYLSHLTDKVYSIEIIKPLAERARGIYDQLIKDGYNEFRRSRRRRPTAVTAGRIRPVRQDHRHLRHRPHASAALAAAGAERDHGRSGGAAGRAARPQDRQVRRRRRPADGRLDPISTADASSPSCPSPSSRASRSSARTTTSRSKSLCRRRRSASKSAACPP